MTATTGTTGPATLLARMSFVEQRIRMLVDARRAVDPQPDDPFRGLYLSDESVDRVLDAPPSPPPWSREQDPLLGPLHSPHGEPAPDGTSRLDRLARTCGLSELDVGLLLVALTCDLDSRFEKLFGYLNDDVTRRRPSAGVALELCGHPLTSVVGRERLTTGPLVRRDLLVVEDPDRPFPGRAIRVPDRVVAHLLGSDEIDPALADVVVATPTAVWGDGSDLARALDSGIRFCYLREPPTGSGLLVAHDALRRSGLECLVVDLDRVGRHPDPSTCARIATREARLRSCGLVALQAETVCATGLLQSLRIDPLPLLLVGAGPWDPAWTVDPPLLLDVRPSTAAERGRLWREALADLPLGFDPGAESTQFLLRPGQVPRAACTARQQSLLSTDNVVTAEHLRIGARAENASALQRLSRRVEPQVGWDDLVLPPATRSSLVELAARGRHRERVLSEWSMRPGGGRGMGVAALFAGDSGTGKTMSAEVLAGELGLDLYVVDLSTLVDKYIGETEKNLDRIFTAAAGVNGILFFDEADAVFGKRSEVKDAHDRYANVESAYLLQRMESFDGLVILATNLRANIDEAFTRRLDVIVDFPLPDAARRLELWRSCLASVPTAEPLDLEFCASAFELSGGAIRSAAVTAAYLAADADGIVSMGQVVQAVQREYRKLGRLCLAHEFGAYHSLLA
ncbi:MAG: ATP-binding protein [Intrasporangium sp.]|uniref:ATP-binding protein n=1 Tax=Intrasporangium sp. TaxID=1925024 RepID=UPI002649899C|nr:ATP-binding protein [Intrasporangium sp.]MDN5796624.1 ATP-binding protein [Intrasporangium sp.]